MKYTIEDYELPVRSSEGEFESYRLDAVGDNIEELMSTAMITAMDQDSNALYSTPLQDSPEPFLIGLAENAIIREVKKQDFKDFF